MQKMKEFAKKLLFLILWVFRVATDLPEYGPDSGIIVFFFVAMGSTVLVATLLAPALIRSLGVVWMLGAFWGGFVAYLLIGLILHLILKRGYGSSYLPH